MSEQKWEEGHEHVHKSKWRKASRYALTAVAGVAIFIVGVSVGQGRISLHSSAPVNANLPDTLNYSSVNQVYKSLRDNYAGTLTESQLIDGLKHGLAEAANDPYTEYFTAKEAKSFSDQLNNSFSGIGAELGKDKDGNLIVVSPIAGFPAEKAGLKPQDIIVTIDGKSTAGISIDEAVSKIRGQAGTTVKLQVVRNHADQLDVSIVRQNIQIPSVNTKILDNNIGYIQITTFADDTSALIKQAADKMKQANVKGIILDMRNNPGGLLNAAVDVSSEWLPQGTQVLQEKRGNTVVNNYVSGGGDQLHNIPTVVLVNAGSASASEITAGALHDNKAAYIIGVKSYGKGVVQQLINFGDGSELKVTVASWYRPNGQNINKKGISPDQEVKISDADAKDGNDTQLQAAQAYLNK